MKPKLLTDLGVDGGGVLCSSIIGAENGGGGCMMWLEFDAAPSCRLSFFATTTGAPFAGVVEIVDPLAGAVEIVVAWRSFFLCALRSNAGCNCTAAVVFDAAAVVGAAAVERCVISSST